MVSAVRVLYLVVQLLLTVAVLWALGDAATRPAGAFPAAGKQTKVIWLAILGVAALVVVPGLLVGGGSLGLLGIASAVAAGVYLADVRPAVRGITPGGPWR